MSLVSANAFLEKVRSDVDFRNKLTALPDGQARMRYAQEAGYTFTSEDLAQAKSEQNLSDEELDAVAGGCGGGKLCLEGIGDTSITIW